jgi:DNA-binding CsgD family transcriptional regulator
MPTTPSLARQAPITQLTSRVEPLNRRAPGTSRLAQEPSRIVVGIVAAYPSMRAGLGALVQSDRAMTPAAIAPAALAAASGMPALGQIGDADVILIEPNDLDQNTLGSLVGMSRDQGIPLIWLGPGANPELARAGNEPGGIISQDADAETVVAAIRAAQVGLRVIDPIVSNAGSDTATGPEQVGDMSLLSPREREVLGLVASGLPNKAIARSLGISDHTVKFHVSSVLNKLNAGSRTEAVTLATRQGILSL